MKTPEHALVQHIGTKRRVCLDCFDHGRHRYNLHIRAEANSAINKYFNSETARFFSVESNYLCQEGYVFIGVSLLVCL